MSTYSALQDELRAEPRTWLVTGAAGFIGSHLVETLLTLGQRVIGLDNFATGRRENLSDVRTRVSTSQWSSFAFRCADIRDPDSCRAACEGVDLVLHQAALGSVPRSVLDPVGTNATNVGGFLNMLVAARDAKVSRFVYAGSSSTYGDDPTLPKVEDRVGRPLSPYAASKHADELYAMAFESGYGFRTVGLRYFNVFGRRQDPDSPYAAVIPRWVSNLLHREPCLIHGDGETSRDFCYVQNVVQANLLAATRCGTSITGEVYNVGIGAKTTLEQLFRLIRDELARYDPHLRTTPPIYTDFRPGDIRHSQADITKISLKLGYRPTHTVHDGIRETVRWYVEMLSEARGVVMPAAGHTRSSNVVS